MFLCVENICRLLNNVKFLSQRNNKNGLCTTQFDTQHMYFTVRMDKHEVPESQSQAFCQLEANPTRKANSVCAVIHFLSALWKQTELNLYMFYKVGCYYTNISGLLEIN